MAYRPEIDGLRAVAVLPVVFYHADVTGFPGGYIGVDVFFVISGFLITQLIWPECEQGRFSIVRFYERRARRILPALFAVTAFSWIVAYYLFLNSDLLDFSNSLIATMAFLSNVFFFLGDLKYFADAEEVKPLLHTWSLAIEEQFYILYPLLLLVVRKYLSRFMVPVLTLCLLASFVTCVLLLNSKPQEASTRHARAWELLHSLTQESPDQNPVDQCAGDIGCG
jgi:peptidoglycan/LPS O-acetylase OafA/YrhL